MEGSSLLRLLSLASLLSCTAQRASLAVRPDSSQLFEGDTISFRCDDGWTMRRNTSQLQQTECGNDWGNLEGSVCDISFLFPFESGSYWCESKGGGVSNSVTIKITDRAVILQSPVLPVMEGHDVHLLCRTKSPSNRPANFYRNDVLIGSEPEGHMTLRHVNKSAEGLYKCVVREKPSPSSTPPPPSPSWVTLVSSAPPPDSAPLWLVLRLLCHLVVFCPYFISTAIMVSLYQQRSSGSGRSVSVSVATAVSTQHRWRLAEDCDDITVVTTEHKF
ncbi:Fc receptor-like protein 5 isoform X2 [Echeneis naucrates]|uniref:Fc receptor-like protein 5 isoform X2 n=1 Tax=Echeneis naucrates TaxID=173247 RepID=UPI0011144283|nr:Fc receptor-like protein 5 isoform X2 [Echeneis naucrates]